MGYQIRQGKGEGAAYGRASVNVRAAVNAGAVRLPLGWGGYSSGGKTGSPLSSR
jgi:hypothetical protein